MHVLLYLMLQFASRG